MALYKIGDRFPDYKDRYLDGTNIKGAAVYAGAESEQIGVVHDILVDDTGQIRYLVIDTGFWILGKKVLLPVSCCTGLIDGDRIYARGLTRAQVEDLPEYRNDLMANDDYEARVGSIYPAQAIDQSASAQTSTPVEPSAKKYDASLTPSTSTASQASPPSFPIQPAASPAAPADISLPVPNKRVELNHSGQASDLSAESDTHRRIPLYEERLVTDKRRLKTGEITVTKRIETEQVEGSVTIQKEKIIIEIESVPGVTHVNVAGKAVEVGSSARSDIYADHVEIRKEPVVRQEVTVRKEVIEEVVTVRDTVRREEIDVQQQGTPDVDIIDRGF